jgi:hypothetical protein
MFEAFSQREIQEDLAADEKIGALFTRGDREGSVFSPAFRRAATKLAAGAGGAAAGAVGGLAVGKALAGMLRGTRLGGLAGPLATLAGAALGGGTGYLLGALLTKPRATATAQQSAIGSIFQGGAGETLAGVARQAMEAEERACKSPPPSAVSSIGEALTVCTRKVNRDRLLTLHEVEKIIQPGNDFGLLIQGLSPVLETEMNRLLIEPARAIGGILLRHLAAKRDGDRIFKEWIESPKQPTIGVQGVVIMALSRGSRERDARVLDFLSGLFWPERLVQMFQGKDIEKWMYSIRDLRNKAAHGEGSIDHKTYAGFCQKLLGVDRLAQMFSTPVRSLPQLWSNGLLLCNEVGARENFATLVRTSPELEKMVA